MKYQTSEDFSIHVDSSRIVQSSYKLAHLVGGESYCQCQQYLRVPHLTLISKQLHYNKGTLNEHFIKPLLTLHMSSLYFCTNLVLCEWPSKLLPVEGVLAGDAQALLRRTKHAPRDTVPRIVQATESGWKQCTH